MWLSVTDLGYRWENGGASGLSISALTDWVCGGVTRENLDQDGFTLWCPWAVIEVEEGTAEAFIEDCRSTQSERVVPADREATSEDGSSLGRSVELELEVARDVSGAGLCISEDTACQTDSEGAWSTACTLIIISNLS